MKYFLLVLGVWWGCTAAASAHYIRTGQAKLYLFDDATFQLEMIIDLPEFLRPEFGLDGEITAESVQNFTEEQWGDFARTAQKRLQQELWLEGESLQRVVPTEWKGFDVPQVQRNLRAFALTGEHPNFKVIARGEFPLESELLTVKMPAGFGPMKLIVIQTELQEVGAGVTSEPIRLRDRSRASARETTRLQTLWDAFFKAEPAK